MICFIQYLDGKAEKQIKFLFIANLLKNSDSANAETIHSSIMKDCQQKDWTQTNLYQYAPMALL